MCIGFLTCCWTASPSSQVKFAVMQIAAIKKVSLGRCDCRVWWLDWLPDARAGVALLHCGLPLHPLEISHRYRCCSQDNMTGAATANAADYSKASMACMASGKRCIRRCAKGKFGNVQSTELAAVPKRLL